MQVVEVRHFPSPYDPHNTFYRHKSWWSMLPSRLHRPKSWWSIGSSGAMAPAPLSTHCNTASNDALYSCYVTTVRHTQMPVYANARKGRSTVPLVSVVMGVLRLGTFSGGVTCSGATVLRSSQLVVRCKLWLSVNTQRNSVLSV